jgi:sn-glycerol 3-phosphate transport system ATP-binding protein/multiple sugar transport system ATP-binding protein
MSSLSVRGLCKSFGQTQVLDRVDVEVPEGAFAVLVGPSGCGKSTLLRLIAGLEQADRGSIHFGEREVTKLPPRDRDVAMVFQSYALYPHLSVRDNLGFGLRLRKTPAAEIAKRVDEVSSMLGLSKLLERMPRELSGGQRQRVAMGRAIARRPTLFLFDEPLSNLDAALRAQVRVDIKKLHDKLATTSVYVTHDQVEAMTLADVMFVLNRGRVEQQGAPMDVYERPATRFVAGFLGSPAMNFLEGEMGEGGEVAIGAEVRLTLDAGAYDEHRGAVVVGLRPHDLVPGEPGAPTTLPMDVELTEELGGETYAYGAVAGQRLVARLEPVHRVRAGETLPLRVAPERVHLFDPKSGRALRC